MLHDSRKAIGKAWPLFFYVVFNLKHSNKFITSYPELKEGLSESVSTIKKWRDRLERQKVIGVINGRLSMTLTLQSPYDSLTTCEQDDVAHIRMKSDPATKRMLDKISSGSNMSLLPVIAEITSKLDSLEKKLG